MLKLTKNIKLSFKKKKKYIIILIFFKENNGRKDKCLQNLRV